MNFVKTIPLPAVYCQVFSQAPSTLGREIENEVFTQKMHQMFSVCTTLEKFKNAIFSGHLVTFV